MVRAGGKRAEAEEALRDAGIRGPIVTEVVTEQWLGPVDFTRARVCAQSPEPGVQTTTDRRVVLSYCDPDRRPASRQLTTTLSGYPVEEAKRRARRAGYSGWIEVVPLYEFDPICKPATVCGVSPLRWELNIYSPLTLHINRSITITTPN